MEANKLIVPNEKLLKNVQVLCEQENPYDNFL